MITFFVGTPGSGKTYDAVAHIIAALKKGREVFSNIDGLEHRRCLEALKVMSGLDDYEMHERFHVLQNWQVNEFWKHCTPKSLIVLDEVHKNFNSRDWQSEKNKDVGMWASTHRHSGNDLILITQSIEKVDKQIRDLVEWTYHYKKNNFMGKFAERMYLRYAYMEGDTNGKPLRCEKKFYKKEIFACYKSYVADDIKELGIVSSVNILKHPIFFIIPIVIGFFLYMFFVKSSLGTGDLFGVQTAQAKQEKAIKMAQEMDKGKKPVPVYGVGGNVGSVAPVAAPVSVNSGSPVPVPATPSVNRDAELQAAEDARLDREQPTWRNDSWYEDENGVRHYLDGRKVQMVYK